ncbi:MFS transporter [Streptomyces sp. V4I2]|uniref:MFS transporter n=1 Tax=Streptomyces sp. V4I2 TaxID=3042280 RepID=UPI00278877C0|nr:MFS transporter [Streptomyces sp. V4I2]MDQ1050931.1 ACS family D-galactonate transporter-like MFS transporter [Streptomyces sp. V4I2]
MTVGTNTRSAMADGTRRRARTVLAMLALFIVVNAADKAVLGLTAGPIKDDLGLSATEFGTIASSFYLLFSLSAVSVGFLGDRIRPRPLLAVLALVWAVAQLPILLPATGFGALVATRVVLGAGEGPGFPLANYTAFTWYPKKRRALPSAVVVAGGAGGTVLAAPLVVLVSNTLGWRAAFGLLGAAGLVWMLVWLRIGGGGPYAAHLGPGPAGDEPSAQDVPTDTADGERPAVPFRRIVTTGTWLGATFATFTVMWTLSLGFAWLPLFLEDQAGFSDAQISGIVGLPALSMAVLVLTAGVVAHRLLRKGVSARVAQGLVGALLPLVAGVCLLLVTRAGPAALLPLLIVAFSAANGQTPLTNAAIADICPVGRRSAALGLSYALAALSSLLAPYVTGRIIDAAPTEAVGYGRAFDLAACLLIAGAVLSALLIRPDRDALTVLTAHPATSSASATPSVSRGASSASGPDAEPSAKE